MARFFLTGTVGDKPIRFELHAGSQSVGRTGGCDITLPDAAVSRKHAEIEVDGDTIQVQDLSSLNGTFVNEEKVITEALVHPGDSVRFGHLSLTLMERELTPPPNFPLPGTLASNTLTTTFKEIQEQAKKSRSDRILTALSEAGQMLSRRMDMEEIYANVLDMLERFITCSRILILGGEEDRPDGGKPVILDARIIDSTTNEALAMSKHMLIEILQEGKSLLTADAAAEERWKSTDSIIQVGVHAAIGAPLFDNDKILGAIYVDSRRPGVTFQEEDLRLLTLIANMIAVKITNSRLEEEERKLTALRQEMALAARIQRKLLPQGIPPVGGFDIFAHLAPCEDIGGDLYDVRPLTGGNVWLTLGDVTGHGVGAALLMSHVMSGLKFLEEQCHDPVTLIERLESHLGQHVEIGQYVTMFAGILNPATGRLIYVNAGHPGPIVLHGEESQTLEATGTAVSILPGPQVRTFGECMLNPGSTLLIFSDGIPETEVDDVLYGEGRMDQCIQDMDQETAEDAGHALLADLEEFRGERPVDDDLTLLVIKRL